MSVSMGFDTTAIRGMERFPRSPPFCFLLVCLAWLLFLLLLRLLLLLLLFTWVLLPRRLVETIYLQLSLFREKEGNPCGFHCVCQVAHLFQILQLIRPRLNGIRSQQLLHILDLEVQILPAGLLPLADCPRLHIRAILLRMT